MKKRRRLDSIRLLAILIILLGIIYFYFNIFSPKRLPDFLRIGLPRSPINLLILGTDITYDAETGLPMPELEGRADTIMLVHIDPVKNQINALSIPRDTYLEIPGHDWQKINAANAWGGLPLLSQTVSKFTGQKIDYYVKLRPTAITKLVDILGGVTLDVEKDMYYVDHAQNLKINLKKGRQRLSGDQAHSYIRFRHDLTADIGRVERQQKFLKALTKELTKPGNILKSPFALRAAVAEIETNLPLTKTVRLLNLGRFIAIDDIKTKTASGEPVYIKQAGSIWQTDRKELDKTLKEFF
ncbi:MAG: LCP family protein [bacterium]